MWSQSTNVTDGQTDRQTTCDRNTALCTKVHRAVMTHSLTSWVCQNYCNCSHKQTHHKSPYFSVQISSQLQFYWDHNRLQQCVCVCVCVCVFCAHARSLPAAGGGGNHVTRPIWRHCRTTPNMAVVGRGLALARRWQWNSRRQRRMRTDENWSLLATTDVQRRSLPVMTIKRSIIIIITHQLVTSPMILKGGSLKTLAIN